MGIIKRITNHSSHVIFICPLLPSLGASVVNLRLLTHRWLIHPFHLLVRKIEENHPILFRHRMFSRTDEIAQVAVHELVQFRHFVGVKATSFQ